MCSHVCDLFLILNQPPVNGPAAVIENGPWLRRGCSVGKNLNNGGSSATVCTAVEGKSADENGT